MIETERLILRPYRDGDHEPFAEMNAHPEVGAWLKGVLTREESDAMIARVTESIAAHGFGFWAAERKSDGRLVGAIGLEVMDPGMPGEGALELGWRLHPDVWGLGLATEGALAARDWAFRERGADRVVAITAATNLRSQAVMRKLGMTHDPAADFDHPRLDADHPLRRHVFYSVSREAAGGLG